MMYDGKKSTAERALYGAFDIVEQRYKQDPLEVFKKAIENAVKYDKANPQYNYFMGMVSAYHSIHMFHEKRLIELPFQNQWFLLQRNVF